MSELRLNFLNFNPDIEDTENKGLSIAQNVVHDTEGYKPVHLGSAGSFSTTGGLGASVHTVTSIIAKPVGAGSDLFCAWIANDTLHVGLNGVTSAAVTTGFPLSFSTSTPTSQSTQVIEAFDVCEFAGKIFFVVEGSQGQAVPSTIVALKHIGFMDY